MTDEEALLLKHGDWVESRQTQGLWRRAKVLEVREGRDIFGWKNTRVCVVVRIYSVRSDGAEKGKTYYRPPERLRHLSDAATANVPTVADRGRSSMTGENTKKQPGVTLVIHYHPTPEGEERIIQALRLLLEQHQEAERTGETDTPG